MTPPGLIFKAVALEYGVTESAITSSSHAIQAVRARRAAIFLMRAAGHSNLAIGNALGGRDRKGIWVAQQVTHRALAVDADVRRALRRIVERLQLMLRRRFVAGTVPA